MAADAALWMLIGPALALGLLAGVCVAGQDPIWSLTYVNLSEAVALGDFGEVQRQIWLGGNVRRRFPVRGFVLGRSSDLALAPFETAIMQDNKEMLALFQDNGWNPSAEEGWQLYCLAQASGRVNSSAYLGSRFPLSRSQRCQAVQPPW